MANLFAAAAGSLNALFRGARPTTLAAVMLSCVALLVRLPGYGGRPLWIDELWRAVLILDPAFWHKYFFSPSVESAITSLGYAFFVKALGSFQISPDILRLSSMIPGVLTPLMAFFLTRRAGGGVALALLAGFAFALNGNFISYSREMKPYMFEVFVHMGALYAWFTVLQMAQPTTRTWLLYFLVLLLAVFSTTTVIFLLPGSGLTLFLRFLTASADREARARSLAACTALFATIGLVVGGLYYFVWRHGADSSMLSIWADGFSPSGGYVRFLASALAQMWQAAFDTVVGAPLEVDLALALLATTLVWAFVNWRALETRVLYLVLFYLVLAITVCLVNVAKIWPLGASRVNLFLYAYLIMFPVLVAARQPFSNPLAFLYLLGTCLALLWHAHSPVSRAYYRDVGRFLYDSGAPVERSDRVIEDFSSSGSVGRSIVADCSRQKTLILADGYMSTAVSYYTKYDATHRRGAALIDSSCVKYVTYTEAYLHPAETKAALSKILPKISHAWFIYSHLGNDDLTALRSIVAPYGRVTNLTSYEGAGYFELVTSSTDARAGALEK
jgi:hypothetical protein